MFFNFVLIILIQIAATISAFSKENRISSSESIQRLLEGNHRYVLDELEHPNTTPTRRDAISSKQTPFAIIVGCSDSRVSPEIIFDQGLGDLFIVRVAGNVIGPIELDSIEYAALCLDSSVVLVLGHENCGAVTAVLNKNTQFIKSIAKLIEPAVKIARKESGNTLENSIKENVRLVISRLKKRKEIKALIDENKIKVIGGYYDLNTGKVEMINE